MPPSVSVQRQRTTFFNTKPNFFRQTFKIAKPLQCVVSWIHRILLHPKSVLWMKLYWFCFSFALTAQEAEGQTIHALLRTKDSSPWGGQYSLHSRQKKLYRGFWCLNHDSWYFRYWWVQQWRQSLSEKCRLYQQSW